MEFKRKKKKQRYNDITQNRYKCEVQKIDRHETRGAKKKNNKLKDGKNNVRRKFRQRNEQRKFRHTNN